MGGKLLSLERHCGKLRGGIEDSEKETSSGNLNQEKHHLKMPKLTKLSLGHLLLAPSH